MHEPDFWTATAEAMELSIEGNRLIAEEVAGYMRDLWHRIARAFAGMNIGGRRHSVPRS